MRISRLLLWPVAGFLCGSVALASDLSFKPYVNERFATQADVPADFVADPPPVNNDGRRFRGSDGGTVTVYAIRNKDPDGLKGYRGFLKSTLKSEGWDVTYEAGEDNWFVFSGTRGANVLYHRGEQPKGCDGKMIHQIEFQYPAAEADAWKPIVERGADSLDGPCR